MIRLRRRCRAFWLSVALTPVLLWVLAILLAPTGWVRSRLEARLAEATGRSVRIGSVRLGFLGKIRLGDLTFAEPATPGDPWLRVREAKLDLHPGQVVWGTCQPGDLAVDGVAVRVRRRLDGRFEFGDLARPSGPAGAPIAAPSGVSDSSGRLLPAMNWRVSNASVRLIDDRNEFRGDLVDLSAQGSYRPTSARIDELSGRLNGGPIRLAASVDRDPVAPRYALEFQASKVQLDRGLELVQSLVPIVARPDDSMGGRANVRISLRARGASCAEVRRTLAGHGSILLDPIDLDGSQILAELRRLGDWPESSRVAAVSSDFVVADGRITTDDLTIRASQVPFIVAGWTDFDGRFQYETRVDRILAALPREARSVLGELRINADDLAGLRIEGTHDQVRMSLQGRPLADDPARPPAERVRHQETARRIRDSFFR